MCEKKRVLVCEFHQETDTFNPIVMTKEDFAAFRYAEGEEGYRLCKGQHCATHGIIDAIEEAGGEVVPSVFVYALAGGRVSDEVLAYVQDRIHRTIAGAGQLDAVCALLHGATCTESNDDACGTILQQLRQELGEEIPITVSLDLHANVTEKILKNADVVCGHQTYPHVDIYETAYRAGRMCMALLAGERVTMAAVRLPMLTPPVGYSTETQPLRSVMDRGQALVAAGTLLDFTVFNVQPWLDVPEIGSAVVAVAAEAETAKSCARELAAEFFAHREAYWPQLMDIDGVIDRAEDRESKKPVILVDSADSPNGGAVGDSVAVALRLRERGSRLRAAMFVKDPQAVEQAFAVGVGNRAEFTVGAKYTAHVPGPMVAVGRVRSLHDGIVRREGPVNPGEVFSVGRAAVLSFDNLDVLVCHAPAAPGDPQLLRHFGIEPKLYDLVVVKANASFRAAYCAFAGEICYADTPGAGAANLHRFRWQHLPRGLYPFDLPADYCVEPAKIYR
ncbi:MAG: M81 family metallopeptidase [Oscillospiraceae bacterium]|nr:M81 family metallopeptidase [Oscillospiraceae bacterium]